MFTVYAVPISIVAFVASHTAEVVSQHRLTILVCESCSDAFALVSPLVDPLRTSLLTMLASDIIEISKYYFLHTSKYVRGY